MVCAFPAPVILRRGGRASSPSKRYCGRLRVIYTSVLRSSDLPVTGRGTADGLLAAITADLLRARHTASQAQRCRVLPYMDDYLALFSSEAEAQRGSVQIRSTLAWLGLEANPKKCIWTPTQELTHRDHCEPRARAVPSADRVAEIPSKLANCANVT